MIPFSFAADYLYQVDKEFIKLRIGPGQAYPVRDVAELGDQLLLLKRRGEWVKARSRFDTEGWFLVDGGVDEPDRWKFALALAAGVDNSLHTVSGLTMYVRRQQPWLGGVDLRNMLSDYAGTRFYQVFAGYEYSPWKRLSALVQLGGGVASQKAVRSLVGAAENEWASLLALSVKTEWKISRQVSVSGGIATWSLMPDTRDGFTMLLFDAGVVRRF